MNILFVSSARHYGGTERWTTMAVRELERRGHTVWVCCPDVPHARHFTRRERLVPEVPSSIWDTQGRNELSDTMRQLTIDVVVPVSQRMYFICGLIARRLDIAVVLRLGIVRLPWRPVIDWFGYGIWPDATIVNTTSIKRVLSFAPFVQPDRIHVIYNGIGQPPSSAETTENNCFKISFVGTVSWRKGTGHVISALSHLPAAVQNNVRLEIIGDGPGLARCRRMVKKLRLEDRVHFAGHVDNPADLLKSSDLFVLLSSREGISNALLEAMNAGVAGYTTLVGGHGEFIRDGINGYAARTRSPRAVACDLEKIINDPQRQQVALSGQRTVNEMFTTQAMGDALETLFFNVLQQKLAEKSVIAVPQTLPHSADVRLRSN